LKTTEQLQAQLDALNLAVKTQAVRQIHWLMNEHGLTIADLMGLKSKRVASEPDKPAKKTASESAKKVVARKRGEQPPKYRDPKTGATWSGLARPPAWIRNAKNRDRFLINGAA
jgi:DNA-binding protein H-NS